MKEKNTGGPAFPSETKNEEGGYNKGMSLRDYFAAKAMLAIISKTPLEIESEYNPMNEKYKFTAIGAYKYADFMLKAREE